jgi:hypothetical protein
MNKFAFFDRFFFLKFLVRGTVTQVAVRVAFLALIFWCLGYLATAFDKALYLPGEAVGFLDDINNYLFYSLFLLIVLLHRLAEKFFLSFGGFESVEDSHFSLQAIAKFDDSYYMEYRNYVNKLLEFITLKKSLAKCIFYCLQTLMIVFFVTSVYLTVSVDRGAFTNTWAFQPFKYPLGFLACQLKDFTFYVLLAPSIFWCLISMTVAMVLICRKLERDDRFNIKPLSPDNSGGLRPVGEFALMLFYTSAIPLIHLVIVSITISLSTTHELIYPLYAIFLIMTFFLPLGSVHNSMKKAKSKELEGLSTLFNKTYYDFRHATAKTACMDRDFGELMKDMYYTKELYHQANKMPIWPFDFSILIRFLSVVFVPFLLFVLQMLTSMESILKSIGALQNFFE